MIILGLDTTGADCSACLIDNFNILAYQSDPIGRGHAERLGPMVQSLFEEAGISPADIARVAVCTGPGSFTGLRVALSFAKGFALPRDLPVLGFDALQVEANRISQDKADHLVTVYRDVKRGQVFAADYSHGRPLMPPRAVTLSEAEKMADVLQAGLYEAKSCDVRILARLALTAEPEDHPADPLYARAPDAKLPGGRQLDKS